MNNISGHIKIFLVVFLFFFAVNEVKSQDYWISLNSPTERTLSKLSFVDSLKGWIAGDSGVMLYTDNGGQNWSFQNSGITDNFASVFFLDENLGWATVLRIIGLDLFTVILKTTDGGNNWTNYQLSDTNQFYYTIKFINPSTGWMGGENGKIVKSTDGGANWFDVNIDSSVYAGFPVFGFAFYSDQSGYGIGGGNDITGVIWKTIDGGNNWSIIGGNKLGSEPYYGIKIFDSLTTYAVGGDFDFGSSIVKTTDGGANWSYQYLGIFGQASSLSFRTRKEGWSPLGFEQKFMYTLDSGNTWMTMVTPDTTAVYDVQFTDERNGFAVGKKGTILKYNSALINIEYNGSFIPVTSELFQNYPNPFNPSTKIKFSLSKSSTALLKIYDTLGREIRTLHDGFLKAGNYEVLFEAGDLSAGVYFYTLDTKSLTGTGNGFSQTRKLVIIK